MSHFETIWVNTQNSKYPIYVGHDLLKQSALLHPHINSKQVFILSDNVVADHYLCALKQACIEAGANKIDHLLLPSGEEFKTIETAQQVWSALQDSHHYRDTTLITLGGGVINDVGGFSAACYMRGIPVIHYPTTFLAQVDAAIGGKTAVNHFQAKNLIGVFHQPSLVIADLATLETLPQREFNAGLAELIKYGLIQDSALFLWLEKHIQDLIQRSPAALMHAIKRACQLKAQVVGSDEKDEGQRIGLNFGHTIGHALESLLDYKLLHGEAVAIGMIAASWISLQQGILTKEELKRLIFLLEKANLPTKLPQGITVADIWSKIKQDKKHKSQHLRWVLLNGLGKFKVCETVLPLQITFALGSCGAIL
jgi:3-dehydroquinate synthase